jgi:hypothetical protein
MSPATSRFPSGLASCRYVRAYGVSVYMSGQGSVSSVMWRMSGQGSVPSVCPCRPLCVCTLLVQWPQWTRV